MNKAAKVIELLGGSSEISAALNLNWTTVARWKKSKDRMGTGGYIPRWHHDDLLRLASRKKCRPEVAELLRA